MLDVWFLSSLAGVRFPLACVSVFHWSTGTWTNHVKQAPLTSPWRTFSFPQTHLQLHIYTRTHTHGKWNPWGIFPIMLLSSECTLLYDDDVARCLEFTWVAQNPMTSGKEKVRGVPASSNKREHVQFLFWWVRECYLQNWSCFLLSEILIMISLMKKVSFLSSK